MTEFHLVRHAHYDGAGDLLAGRAPGHRLSATGLDQAARLAAGVLRSADVVVSSPLLRARQTADAIAGAAGRKVQVDEAFTEIDLGNWTGRRFADLAGDVAWSAWNGMRSLATPPGVEPMLSVQLRAVAALQRIAGELPGGVVVIVSHADVIRSVLACALGSPLDLMPRLRIDCAHRSVVALGADWVELRGINLPPD